MGNDSLPSGFQDVFEDGHSSEALATDVALKRFLLEVGRNLEMN